MYKTKEITINATIHFSGKDKECCAYYCAFKEDCKCVLFNRFLVNAKSHASKNFLRRCDECIEYFGIEGEE